MQQGKEASVTLSGTSHCLRRVVIPLLYNGSCRIGLLTLVRSPVQLGGPFGFCAFALLSELLLGSLVIASKRTRPRQRFCLCCWARLYDGERRMSRGRNATLDVIKGVLSFCILPAKTIFIFYDNLQLPGSGFICYILGVNKFAPWRN